MFSALDSMDRMIQAGEFPRNPDSWGCSDAWCAYYGRCMRQREEV